MKQVHTLQSASSLWIDSTIKFLRELFPPDGPHEFAVRLWDGTTIGGGDDATFTLVVNDPGALPRIFESFDEATLGEAYVYGDLEIEGSLEDVGPAVDSLLGRFQRRPDTIFKLAARLRALPSEIRPRLGLRPALFRSRRHSKERDRDAIRYHYDVSNEFYRLWLDTRMVYSCAYFQNPTDDLEVAQERKLEYICRKLRLQPDDRLLDIGCGWGGLVIYAATRFGVRSTGITLSQAQYDLARERVRDAGLADRCEIKLLHYQDLNDADTYDKVVSIGMFEHVGVKRLPEYFGRAFRLLRPGGVMLNHGVGCIPGGPVRQGPLFASRFGFPDSEIVPISATLQVAEATGFEVRDVESWREHYLLTLRHWVRRMREQREAAIRATDAATFRAWQLVLSGGAYGIRTGRLNIWQSLLYKPGGASLPLTRDDWYASR